MADSSPEATWVAKSTFFGDRRHVVGRVRAALIAAGWDGSSLTLDTRRFATLRPAQAWFGAEHGRRAGSRGGFTEGGVHGG